MQPPGCSATASERTAASCSEAEKSNPPGPPPLSIRTATTKHQEAIAMPPDSDTIVVQQPGIRLPSPNPCDQPADEMELEEDRSSEPTTPIQRTTQQNFFEIPILPPNKRQAQFSPEIIQRERNIFQNTTTPKPTAKDSAQAIYWARDLILQASPCTGSSPVLFP